MSKKGRQAFDWLFDRPKKRTSAGVHLVNPRPMETIFLSICPEHGKLIEEIPAALKHKNP